MIENNKDILKRKEKTMQDKQKKQRAGQPKPLSGSKKAKKRQMSGQKHGEGS